MEEDIISVIIPVHNAEKTIDYCVESVVNQTYKNLDIILVENGSIDNSWEKCLEWASKDSRVRAVQSEKGVSRARNFGLDMVSKTKSSFFCFLDSDDYVDVTMYSKLYNKAIEENDDMVFCYTKSVQNNVVSDYPEKRLPDLVNKKEARWFFYRDDNSVRTGTIRTMFKTDTYIDIRYDENLSHAEDFLYMLQSLERSERRGLVEEGLYYNVNFHNVPFSFAKKYCGRFNFYESGMIFSKKIEPYMISMNCQDIIQQPAFDKLIMLINAIVGTEKHWLKEIHRFVSNPYWKKVNNKGAYCQYLETVKNCSLVVKIKAFFVVHKMYFVYGISAKIFALLKS